jgi:hypothetical protein
MYVTPDYHQYIIIDGHLHEVYFEFTHSPNCTAALHEPYFDNWHEYYADDLGD